MQISPACGKEREVTACNVFPLSNMPHGTRDLRIFALHVVTVHISDLATYSANSRKSRVTCGIFETLTTLQEITSLSLPQAGEICTDWPSELFSYSKNRSPLA